MPPAPLRVAALADDPFIQFNEWFREYVATDPAEPDAVALATATADGRASLRMVLARKVGPGGFTFFTHYESRKGEELASNPRASLLYYWAVMDRQVRIEGAVVRVLPEESDAYFRQRPQASRVSAIASPQSHVVESRAWLEARHREIAARHADDAPRRPDAWGGFRVIPDRYEFWQNGADRLHDRILYQLEPGGAWTRSRLAP